MAEKGLSRIAVVLLLVIPAVALLLLTYPCCAEDWFGSPVVTTTPFNLVMVRAADITRDGLTEAVIQIVGGESLIVYQVQRDGDMTRMPAFPDFYDMGTHQEYVFFDYFADGQTDLVLDGPLSQLDIDSWWNGTFSNGL